MNVKELTNTIYIAISGIILFGISSHAQTPENDMQSKVPQAEEQLVAEKTRKSLFRYKKAVASQTNMLKDKPDQIREYSKAAKLLRGMLKSSYDPTFIAPTSLPLADPNLSSGSDPSQISDPLEREKAIEASNLLAKKIAEHNFQRDLRKEMDAITQRAKLSAEITENDDKELAVKKLVKAGLSEADAATLLEPTSPIVKPDQK
jgi:hypothetical protein